ncbi:hypothetical protein [Blastococcus haudaquaticus]|nr:hypothetical protein [Blastococcus haudaquaticus]
MSAEPTRRTRSLGVLVVVCLAVLLSAVPGVASAATVTPFVDCYRANANGTITVVLGYTNPNTRNTAIPLGTRNSITPTKFQGAQPTVFKPGTQRGVFSITATQADMWANPRWVLDGNTLDQWSAGSVAQCSPSTPLPAIGNGTGLAVALLAGGAFGVFFVRRLRRRAAAAG